MRTAAEERNEAPVLEVFDTLVGKRDYAAAQRFWSHSDVIQHGANAEQSKSGLPMFDDTFPTPRRP